MKTTIAAILLCSLMLFSVQSYGATNKCTVVKSEGNRMVLVCDREVKEFRSGARVKMKTERAQD